MFGIFYMFYNIVFGAASRIDESINNDRLRSKAKLINDDTYYDYKNQLRLTENNRQVYVTTRNNHKMLVDLLNGKIYKDITKENENKKIKEIKNSGGSVICDRKIWKNENYLNKLWYKCDMIPYYKDINTGSLYTKILINNIWFYMDVDTGKIVRPADGEDLSNKKFNVSIKDIIRIFNNRQEKIKEDERFPEQWWWVKSEFYLNNKIINIKNNKIEITRR